MKMRVFLRIVLMAVVVAAVSPVWADHWYEHYARAEKALMDADHQRAIAELNQAIERRGDSGARVRTYGMRVTDYFPYLKLGIAYFAAGEYKAALRAFETEEQLGAIQDSQTASDELGRFRARASEALDTQREEQRRTVRNLIDQNLAQARNLEGLGQLDEALAAVNRALALEPDNTDVLALAEVLREEVARRDADSSRRERVSELVSEGDALRASGRLAEAAARYRLAMDLDPEGAAGALLAEVQTELAGLSDTGPTVDHTETLNRADALLDRNEFESALGVVQEVLATEPDNARAADLEDHLLGRIADGERQAEIRGNLAVAEQSLAGGEFEEAITAANLVLARDRGNADALRVIQMAYASLSRRLLGEGPVQNLPPAIRFADMRESAPNGSLVHVVGDPNFRLSGVVIDDSEVALVAMTGDEIEVVIDRSSQIVGAVTITEFRFRSMVPVGVTVFEVVATDAGGLSSRSEYAVEYQRPVVRSPWFWGSLIALSLLAAAGFQIRRSLRRRRLLRLRFNPFVAGPPVLDPELFVGRRDLVDRVLATVPNNSLLLLGERRIGKTSMLHQLGLQLPKLDHPRFCFVPVPIDLQGVAEEAFFATVAEAVGETIGDERMSAARAADGYDSRELVRDLRRVLPTVECADDRQAKLVLLFDEIDELNGYSHRTNQRLRSLFMRGFADQLVAVAAGVGIARQWDHEGSPWYNFFEELEVGPIDVAAARMLATRPLGGVIAIDAAAVDRLLDEADGRPYILQKLALAAVQRVHEGGRSRITLEDVETSVVSS
jgi:tetratricopeptide (TPR) repeat protein